MDEITISKVSLISNNNSYKKQENSLQSQASAKTTSAVKATDLKSDSLRSDTVQVQSTITLKNLDTVKVIEQMHARLNQLVKGVRETNELINNAADNVDQLKNGLQSIVKNFPPYSVDSKERQDILMQYISLRKEILALQVPPPPAPVYEKVGRMWDSLFDEYGHLQKTAVPNVNLESSDSQLGQASAALDTTSAKLADLSTAVTQALVNS